MDRVYVRRLTAIASVVVCALVGAASASAATPNPFGCRASLARVGLGGTTLVEPIVANQASSPCATDTSGLNSASVPSVGSLIALAGPAGVFTYSSSSQPTTTGTVAPGAAALASVDGVTIPTSSGPIVIVGPVQASASYACVNGGVVAKSNSTLDLLYINGNRITLTPNENGTIQLGGGSYVSVNEKIQTSTSVTERILDVHLQGLADIVVGEARVTQDAADPCAGTSSSTPPAVNACPNGSTYDPVSGYCVIKTPGGGVIVISRPFQGPTGGSVLAVSVARKLYKSKCLAGRGPAYAIVGTNKNDRINGTHRPERILGLGGNDRIAGQGGNDCLDGGAGNDRMWGGNGNNRDFGGSGNDRISVQNGNAYVDGGSGSDRIFLGNGNDVAYGGAGNDRISVGRGRDRVYGGSGNDDLSTGDGNDWVWGGSGRDRIWVGNGKDHVYGQAGNDRLYAPGEKDYVDCGSGANLAFVNLYAASYAQRHGCGRVRMVRPHRL